MEKLNSNKISVRPTEEIVLEFADGVEKIFKFNMRSLLILSEAGHDIVHMLNDRDGNLSDQIILLFYAGLKTSDPEMTYETAENIFESLDIESGSIIVAAITNSITLPQSNLKKTKTTIE